MKRRTRLTQAQWKAHIEAWQHSGGTQAAYCREHDLTDKVFSLWKRRFQKQNALGVPIPDNPKSSSSDFVPVKITRQSSGQDQILLRLPSGIEMQLTTAALNGLNPKVVSDLCQIR